MRISEIARRSGTTSRLLRYYEEQGLLVPERDATGYRDFSEGDLVTVRRIRQLLAAGLGTATIRAVLPCLAEREGRLAPVCDETLSDLARELHRIEISIDALTASRDAIGAVIDEGRKAMSGLPHT